MKRQFVFVTALVGAIALLGDSAFAQRPGPGKMRERMGGTSHVDIQGRGDNGPKVGEVAPDFRLTPLKFYEFGIDEAEITKENASELYAPVRLSAFKGEKPVVLIFGSYT